MAERSVVWTQYIICIRTTEGPHPGTHNAGMFGPVQAERKIQPERTKPPGPLTRFVESVVLLERYGIISAHPVGNGRKMIIPCDTATGCELPVHEIGFAPHMGKLMIPH